MVGAPDSAGAARALFRRNDEDEVDSLGHAERGRLEVARVVVVPSRSAVLTGHRIAFRVPGCQMAVDPAVLREVQLLPGTIVLPLR